MPETLPVSGCCKDSGSDTHTQALLFLLDDFSVTPDWYQSSICLLIKPEITAPLTTTLAPASLQCTHRKRAKLRKVVLTGVHAGGQAVPCACPVLLVARQVWGDFCQAGAQMFALSAAGSVGLVLRSQRVFEGGHKARSVCAQRHSVPLPLGHCRHWDSWASHLALHSCLGCHILGGSPLCHSSRLTRAPLMWPLFQGCMQYRSLAQAQSFQEFEHCRCKQRLNLKIWMLYKS